MLLELHLKNFALIENADLEFNDGLTILSGETGAGKSILIDSINIALGAKTGKDAIRSGAEYAYIELVFQIMDNSKIEKIKALDIAINDDNILIITRKIMQNRSIMRVNDESITSGKLKELTGLLIDIHGQHEHQSLMHASKHLQFVDLMSPEKLVRYREKISVLFNRYNIIENMLADNMDVQMREREADILKYEIDEIEKSNIKKGEEEKIREIFTGYKNASKINENLSKAAEVLETDNLTHAIKSLHEVATYDKKLLSITQLDQYINDAKHANSVWVN